MPVGVTAFYIIFIFLFGLIFGSFYNVLIYRMPLGLPVAKGRSECPNCKTVLKPKDLIPLFSQLFLRSRCRYCGNKISKRYFIIEITTALLFLLSFAIHGPTWDFVINTIFWSVLLITAIIDYDHMIILDSVLLMGAIPKLISFFLLDSQYKTSLLGFATGFGFFFLIYWTAKLIYKKEAFGFGDVLLAGVVGLYVGLTNSIMVIILSFIISAVSIVIVSIISKKRISGSVEIPFGPYICIAAFITSIFGEKILTAYLNMFF